MESVMHTMTDLFQQLGLPSEPGAIEEFVTCHSPLPTQLKLWEAPFWTPTQAAFLNEQILGDADWAEVVDHLDALLRH